MRVRLREGAEGELKGSTELLVDFKFLPSQDVIPPPSDEEQKRTLLQNIFKLMKKFPATTYEELTIIFLDFLQPYRSIECFASLAAEIEDCELKRILLEEQ
jgi:hypothetical protein